MQISEEINSDLDGFQLVHCLYFRVYLLQQMCLFWKNAYQLWTKSYAIIQEKHGTQFWYEKQKVFLSSINITSKYRVLFIQMRVTLKKTKIQV
jgi:hypothetical protein